jgi:hypothetical protein
MPTVPTHLVTWSWCSVRSHPLPPDGSVCAFGNELGVAVAQSRLRARSRGPTSRSDVTCRSGARKVMRTVPTAAGTLRQPSARGCSAVCSDHPKTATSSSRFTTLRVQASPPLRRVRPVEQFREQHRSNDTPGRRLPTESGRLHPGNDDRPAVVGYGEPRQTTRASLLRGVWGKDTSAEWL